MQKSDCGYCDQRVSVQCGTVNVRLDVCYLMWLTEAFTFFLCINAPVTCYRKCASHFGSCDYGSLLSALLSERTGILEDTIFILVYFS